MDAIRAGDTFATIGPLAEFRVEGRAPGQRIDLPAGGGTLAVEWDVASVALPVTRIEVVRGGLVVADSVPGEPLHARGRASIQVDAPTWLALRVRGSYRGEPTDVAAHTSAVQVRVGRAAPFAEADAGAVLEQIQGAIAFVDTVATRPDVRRLRALRATLESAYERLHRRMHAAGIFHRHVLHHPDKPHEH